MRGAFSSCLTQYDRNDCYIYDFGDSIEIQDCGLVLWSTMHD